MSSDYIGTHIAADVNVSTAVTGLGMDESFDFNIPELDYNSAGA